MKFGDRNPSSQPEMEENNCNMFHILGGGDVCSIMAWSLLVGKYVHTFIWDSLVGNLQLRVDVF